MADQASQGIFSPMLQKARLDAVQGHLKGRVLDIGCGNGALTDYVSAANYLGVDRDAATIAVARANHPNHTFAYEVPAEERFDTVVALALLEHMPDPDAAIREWAGWLKDSGRIVLTTPHKSFRWAHDFGSSIRLFSKDAADEHEVMFDERSLTDLVRGAGLKLVTYRRFLFGVNQLCIAAK